HLFIQRIPRPIAERWLLPVAARWIRAQVAADESQLIDATLQFGNAVGGRDTRRLRQRTYADKVLREHFLDAVHQVVGVLDPVAADELVTEVVTHPAGAR